eukprot:922399-Prorocentrum_minimum.AAC.2
MASSAALAAPERIRDKISALSPGVMCLRPAQTLNLGLEVRNPTRGAAQTLTRKPFDVREELTGESNSSVASSLNKVLTVDSTVIGVAPEEGGGDGGVGGP